MRRLISINPVNSAGGWTGVARAEVDNWRFNHIRVVRNQPCFRFKEWAVPVRGGKGEWTRLSIDQIEAIDKAVGSGWNQARN